MRTHHIVQALILLVLCHVAGAEVYTFGSPDAQGITFCCWLKAYWDGAETTVGNSSQLQVILPVKAGRLVVDVNVPDLTASTTECHVQSGTGESSGTFTPVSSPTTLIPVTIGMQGAFDSNAVHGPDAIDANTLLFTPYHVSAAALSGEAFAFAGEVHINGQTFPLDVSLAATRYERESGGLSDISQYPDQIGLALHPEWHRENVEDEIVNTTIDGHVFSLRVTSVYIWLTGGHWEGRAGTGLLAPVYRFWSNTSLQHFYTTNEKEKRKLINACAESWTFEKSVFQTCPTQLKVGVQPVYRFWNEGIGSHFYTINTTEKEKLTTLYADIWTLEGVAFQAYPPGEQPDDALPVHRFWSPFTGSHFYTASESERTKLETQFSDVWTYEGIAWYIPAS